MRVVVLILVLLLQPLADGPALGGEEPDEDHVQVCPVISPELARKAADEVKGHSACSVTCRGCGCKGGPGYRGPRGCVGWAELIRVCGPPPHASCTRECAIVQPGCRGRAWLKTFAAGLGLPAGLTFVPAQLEQEQPTAAPPGEAEPLSREPAPPQ